MSGSPAHATGLADDFLVGMDAAAVRAILAAAHERRFLPEQVLFRTGEAAERLFLIRRGRVRFSRLTTGGRDVVLGILVPGDLCGLGSLHSPPINYIGTAAALDACRTLVWTHRALQRLALLHPQLTENALRVALRYVAMFIERHLRLVSNTAEQRLARTLTRLGTRAGVPTPSGIHLDIKNDQLASLADVSPFTASRLLKAWERDGALRKTRGSVDILQPEKLLVD